MKVLQINAVNRISSTGMNCFEISEYLISQGYECITAYSQSNNANDESEFIIGNKLDTKIHGLYSRISGKQGYFSVKATKNLIKFMSQYMPDVVVLGNLHGNYINFPMLLRELALKNIPTIAVLHDCWFYTGKCCHYTVDNCNRWKLSCGNCPSLKKYNKSWFFDKTLKMLNDKKNLFDAIPRLAVVGVSSWITEEAKKAPVFKSAKEITKIYNWIDMNKFYARKTDDLRGMLNFKSKQVILCVASLWSVEKGLDIVVQLSEKLSDNQRLLVVGNVKGEVKWNEKTKYIPLTNSIDELAEYYSMADVFVQPSIEETFGKVSAEALACGTPIVCFDSTANPELVGEGCGLIVPTGDIKGMYRAVNEVLANGKYCYSLKCVDFVKVNFNKEYNIEKYISLFNKIMEES